jgi:hypothetical protein
MRFTPADTLAGGRMETGEIGTQTTPTSTRIP